MCGTWTPFTAKPPPTLVKLPAGDGQVVAAANAFHYVGVHNGVAVDSSTDQTLAITIQQSHNSLISATCEVVQVELV